MSEEENKIQIFRPFGPSVAKVIMPEKIIELLNEYVDKVIDDKKKSKELDYGNQLAGNVLQEFKLEEDFMKSSGWANFLANASSKWLEKTEGKKKIHTGQHRKPSNLSLNWIYWDTYPFKKTKDKRYFEENFIKSKYL